MDTSTARRNILARIRAAQGREPEPAASEREAAQAYLASHPQGPRPTMPADLVAHFSEVTDVHHVHIWALTRERPIATLHAQVAEGADPLAMTLAIRTHLSTRYGLYHVTVQIEGDVCADTVTGREAGMQVSHSH